MDLLIQDENRNYNCILIPKRYSGAPSCYLPPPTKGKYSFYSVLFAKSESK